MNSSVKSAAVAAARRRSSSASSGKASPLRPTSSRPKISTLGLPSPTSNGVSHLSPRATSSRSLRKLARRQSFTMVTEENDLERTLPKLPSPRLRRGSFSNISNLDRDKQRNNYEKKLSKRLSRDIMGNVMMRQLSSDDIEALQKRLSKKSIFALHPPTLLSPTSSHTKKEGQLEFESWKGIARFHHEFQMYAFFPYEMLYLTN